MVHYSLFFYYFFSFQIAPATEDDPLAVSGDVPRGGSESRKCNVRGTLLAAVALRRFFGEKLGKEPAGNFCSDAGVAQEILIYRERHVAIDSYSPGQKNVVQPGGSRRHSREAFLSRRHRWSAPETPRRNPFPVARAECFPAKEPQLTSIASQPPVHAESFTCVDRPP